LIAPYADAAPLRYDACRHAAIAMPLDTLARRCHMFVISYAQRAPPCLRAHATPCHRLCRHHAYYACFILIIRHAPLLPPADAADYHDCRHADYHYAIATTPDAFIA